MNGELGAHFCQNLTSERQRSTSQHLSGLPETSIREDLERFGNFPTAQRLRIVCNATRSALDCKAVFEDKAGAKADFC